MLNSTIFISFHFRTGLVESNIRKLVNDLEKNEYILIAHVNTEAVELPPEPPGHRFLKIAGNKFLNHYFCSPRFISRWFLGLSFFKTEVQVRRLNRSYRLQNL